MIAVNEQSSSDKFIKNNIDNSFYNLDTKFNTYLTDCSLSNLKLINIDNTFFESKCFKIPEIYKNHLIEINNESLGVYKICYKYDLNTIKTATLNKNKEIIEENNKSCIIKYYDNKFVNINLLKELSDFYNNSNSIISTSLNLASDITFIKNGKTFNKQNYINNNISLYDTFVSDDIQIYVSEYNDNIIYYYNINTKELTLFVNKISINEDTTKALEYIFKKIQTNFIVVNGNINDPSFKIKIKE